jgi:hypothetical protein
MAKKSNKSNRLPPEMTLEEMDRRVAAWVSSPQGKEQLQETQRAARAAADRVTSDAKIDAEQLRQAVTL